MAEMEILLSGDGRIDARFNGFYIKTDQKRPDGSPGEAPSPFQLFLASLGTCAGFFVKSFFDSRKLRTDGLKLFLRTQADKERKRVSKITIEVKVPPDFPEKYQDALIRAVDMCTVKRHILEPPEFETKLMKER